MKAQDIKSTILSLIESKKEGVYWDFKAQYSVETKSIDLIHDIICLANADHDGDRYIIFGITNDFKQQDISRDPNRKTQAQLIDMLRAAKFADDIFPDVKLEVLDLNNVKLDVLTIKNMNNKPYYLTEDKNTGGKSTLSAGTIYTRIMDTNTPKYRVASSTSIEKMWKERFGLLSTPLERFKIYLKDFKNWKSVSSFSSNNRIEFFYQLFPEFTIQRTDNDHGMEHHNFEWARGEIGYHYNQYANSTSLFELCYHNTPLAYIALATFDAGKKTIVAPEWFPVGQGRLYCYLEDSLEYIYQHYFLVGYQNHKDDSIELSYASTKPDNIRDSVFSIPVLKNQRNLEEFINFVKGKFGITEATISSMPLTDEDQQNQFFYQLVEYHKQYSRLSKYEIS